MIAALLIVCTLGPSPDARCTPGRAIPNVTRDAICRRGYARDERYVTTATKRAVFAAYGVKTHAPGQYEVDHLISLELGGSNDVSNLWPQAAEPTPGFHEKDRLEGLLHEMVCKGLMPLGDAQVGIAGDWLGLYRRLVGQ